MKRLECSDGSISPRSTRIVSIQILFLCTATLFAFQNGNLPRFWKSCPSGVDGGLSSAGSPPSLARSRACSSAHQLSWKSLPSKTATITTSGRVQGASSASLWRS